MSKSSSSSPRAKRAATRPPEAPRVAETEAPIAAVGPAVVEAPEPAASDPKGKLGILVQTLRTPGGVSLHDLAAASGWQLHSVRGAMAGALKQRGYAINSKKDGKDATRLYSLVEGGPRHG